MVTVRVQLRGRRRRLEHTLGTLARLAHRAAEDIDDVERDGEIAPRRGSLQPT